MAFRTLAATAGLALAAEAFMIPSTISLPGVEVHGEGEFRALRMPDILPEQLKSLHMGVSQPHPNADAITKVILDCRGCSFNSENGDPKEAAQSAKNDLVLDFMISEDRQTLHLNGLPLFPPAAQRGPLTAYQILSKGLSDEPLYGGDRTLEYAIAAQTVEAADGTDAQLIDLNLSILALEGEPINVDGVDIRMLREEAGPLRLVHIVAAPGHGQPQNGHTQEAEVHDRPPPMHDSVCPNDAGIVTMMCELRTKLIQKANDWRLIQPNDRPHRMHKKPCPGRMRMHPEFNQEAEATVAVPFTKGGPSKFMHHGFHPHNHSRPHHHHSFIHAFGRVIRGFVLGFMVPVLIGVIAGMTASLLGMLVGTVIAWLWVKFVRGGKRGNASARQEARAAMVEEEVYIGEKDGLMLEHAPAYEEAVGEELPVYAEKA